MIKLQRDKAVARVVNRYGPSKRLAMSDRDATHHDNGGATFWIDI